MTGTSAIDRAWHAAADGQRVTYDPAIELTICSRCGTVAEGEVTSLPLGWSTSTVDDRIDALCDRCTRDHVRDIESKLDEIWWEEPG